jgi:hypothetical protein
MIELDKQLKHRKDWEEIRWLIGIQTIIWLIIACIGIMLNVIGLVNHKLLGIFYICSGLTLIIILMFKIIKITGGK